MPVEKSKMAEKTNPGRSGKRLRPPHTTGGVVLEGKKKNRNAKKKKRTIKAKTLKNANPSKSNRTAGKEEKPQVTKELPGKRGQKITGKMEQSVKSTNKLPNIFTQELSGASIYEKPPGTGNGH